MNKASSFVGEGCCNPNLWEKLLMVDMFEWPLVAQKIRRILFTLLLLTGATLTLFACNMTY